MTQSSTWAAHTPRFGERLPCWVEKRNIQNYSLGHSPVGDLELDETRELLSSGDVDKLRCSAESPPFMDFLSRCRRRFRPFGQQGWGVLMISHD